MQFCCVRSPVGSRDPHQDVLRTVFGIFHEDVEVAVVLEDASVEEFILHVVLRTTAVRLHQVGVRKRLLWVLVEILHVRVRRRAVEIEVILFHILAVVAFAVREAEEPFLQDGILPVPQSEREAQALFVIGNAGDAVLAPAVSA